MSQGISVLDDRYELGVQIGRGGMADVFRATDRVLGRTVAVKLLRNVAADGPERARFVREAQTLAALSHPNLITVLDAGVNGEQPFLVMELVEGSTLASHCDGSSLDPTRVARLGVQLAEALAYAQGAGVVHRDVKPANVLVTKDDRALLADFGIARLLSETTHHTSVGTTVGSAPYLAPEQVRGEPPTPAVDVYSLGLVLLEALTGRRAYRGTPSEAAFARLHRSPEIPPEVPPAWAQLLTSMTSLEPSERPSAREVRARLQELASRGASSDDTAPDATRVLEVPVPVPSGVGEDAETHVLRSPAMGTRLGERLRSWTSWAATRVGAARRRLPSTNAPLAVILILGVMSCAFVVLLVVAATSDDGSSTRSGDPVPAGVRPDLRDPLQELHDAIQGGDG